MCKRKTPVLYLKISICKELHVDICTTPVYGSGKEDFTDFCTLFL